MWFLRSFEERNVASAVLAGLAAAAAMLGKYWSIVLLTGLAFAAFADPRRRAYFRSPAPWLTVAAGALALAPHLVWLLTHQGASPFDYALDKHPAPSFVDAIMGSLKFLAGAAAYAGAPIVLAAAATLPTAPAILDTMWPPTPHRRFAALAFWAPLAIAILAARRPAAQRLAAAPGGGDRGAVPRDAGGSDNRLCHSPQRRWPPCRSLSLARRSGRSSMAGDDRAGDGTDRQRHQCEQRPRVLPLGPTFDARRARSATDAVGGRASHRQGRRGPRLRGRRYGLRDGHRCACVPILGGNLRQNLKSKVASSNWP